MKGSLPSTITSASNLPDPSQLQTEEDRQEMVEEVDSSFVVEEVVFHVMDKFFTTYNLRHMYWPELRCLKTCCRVFERLIQIKLPVLADHFEHHELNVGLFALGWFQTLFLYLPSMPSATVCHMWDIWLVERSLKIFFRVGTAILFLSQPILLNHELEGMMENEIDSRQHELEEPAHAVNKIADALPGLGIVAAVLGIVITMNFLTEGPEKIGLSVAAALVGTFLGIFMGYGFVGPASIAMEHAAKYELKAYECVKSAIVATVSGQAPQMAIEFGRKALPTDKRPGFQELNDHVRSK